MTHVAIKRKNEIDNYTPIIMALIEIDIINIRAKKKIQEYDGKIIDVTSKSNSKFSPFYSHGSIPVPGSNDVSSSVEGIWQGLKIFENYGIDKSKFNITNMKNIKRTCRKYGKVIGHKYGDEILDYISARKIIYIPTYLYILKTYLRDDINELKTYKKIAFLDYDTNDDIENTSKPLSHASIIRNYLLSNVA